MTRQPGKDRMEWWLGSNGNLFADSNTHRYCIGADGPHFWVTCNGEVITRYCATVREAQSIAEQDAATYIERITP